MRPQGLLMLDEVNAGLNSSEIDGALALIRKIAERGITILVIEHLMKVVMSLAERVLVLHHGELIAEGAPRTSCGTSSVIEAYLGEKFARRVTAEAAMAEPLLTIEGLSAGYGDVRVLWDITSPSRPARSPASSARTAPARPRCCAPSPAWCRPAPAASGLPARTIDVARRPIRSWPAASPMSRRGGGCSAA